MTLLSPRRAEMISPKLALFSLADRSKPAFIAARVRSQTKRKCAQRQINFSEPLEDQLTREEASEGSLRHVYWCHGNALIAFISRYISSPHGSSEDIYIHVVDHRA